LQRNFALAFASTPRWRRFRRPAAAIFGSRVLRIAWELAADPDAIKIRSGLMASPVAAVVFDQGDDVLGNQAIGTAVYAA